MASISNNQPFLHRCAVSAVYKHDFNTYWHDNSQAGIDLNAMRGAAAEAKKNNVPLMGFFGTPFQYRRSDNMDDIKVSLSFDFDFHLHWKDRVYKQDLAHTPEQNALVLSYEFTRTDSNLPDPSKTDHIVRLGVSSDF